MLLLLQEHVVNPTIMVIVDALWQGVYRIQAKGLKLYCLFSHNLRELLLWVSYKTSANLHDKWQNIQVAGHVTEGSPVSPETFVNVILDFSCPLTILAKVRVFIHILLQVLPTFCAG
jgi:hypothetical protein